jgi:fucose permease
VILVATGLGWVLLPAGWPAYALAAVFAGWVSSLFPVANVLAVERFGQNGAALGAYRSAQIAIGAAAGAAIGVVGDRVGLRPTLMVAVVTPALLLWICRDPHDTGEG